MSINKTIEYKGYKIVSKGYNKKIYKKDKLIVEFTSTIVGARNYVDQLINNK